MRKRTIAGVILVAGIWWMRSGGEPELVAPRTQAVVLPGGFAVLVDHKVRELDRDAAKQHEMQLRLDAEVRLVGTGAGTGVGWRDGKKIKLALLDSDGNPDDVTSWGKKATQLCDGAASNEHRFGVGWLESDGTVWFVHGPAGRAADLALMETGVETAKISWCGIASAEQNVALLWREGSKTYLNFCGPKQCSSLVAKVPISSNDTLLGFGCVRDACLFATRDRAGATKLHRVTEQGRTIVKPLPGAGAETSISVVGAGTRAFAISYIATGGVATVERVTVEGTFTDVWHFEGEREAPALAWADDTLLVAFASEKSYAVGVPR